MRNRFEVKFESSYLLNNQNMAKQLDKLASGL
jgi:hypothetical protein